MLMMFYLNVFYLPTLKDVVGHYKLWSEVMFWFTQMICYNVYKHPICVQNCRVMKFMLFMISIKKNPILCSL